MCTLKLYAVLVIRAGGYIPFLMQTWTNVWSVTYPMFILTEKCLQISNTISDTKETFVRVLLFLFFLHFNTISFKQNQISPLNDQDFQLTSKAEWEMTGETVWKPQKQTSGKTIKSRFWCHFEQHVNVFVRINSWTPFRESSAATQTSVHFGAFTVMRSNVWVDVES